MADNQRPPRIAPRLKSAPKMMELYWCDFPKDAQLPEFWKRRPVIIISRRNTLYGTVTVIPCSTRPQEGNKWAFRLQTTIDGKDGWAICDKPYTVAVSRLIRHKSSIKRMDSKEFNQMMDVVFRWLPNRPEKLEGAI